MTGRRLDLTAAPRLRLPAVWPDDPSFSSDSYIGAIERGEAGPNEARWVRDMAEKLEPRERRDAAIRAAAQAIRCTSISATAKALAAHLQRYIAGPWADGEALLAAPAPDASALRRNLWRIARLTDGSGLGWRRILEIIE